MKDKGLLSILIVGTLVVGGYALLVRTFAFKAKPSIQRSGVSRKTEG